MRTLRTFRLHSSSLTLPTQTARRILRFARLPQKCRPPGDVLPVFVVLVVVARGHSTSSAAALLWYLSQQPQHGVTGGGQLGTVLNPFPLIRVQRNHNISEFIFSTPFTSSGKARGSVGEQCMMKTILTVGDEDDEENPHPKMFPYLKKRSVATAPGAGKRVRAHIAAAARGYQGVKGRVPRCSRLQARVGKFVRGGKTLRRRCRSGKGCVSVQRLQWLPLRGLGKLQCREHRGGSNLCPHVVFVFVGCSSAHLATKSSR